MAVMTRKIKGAWMPPRCGYSYSNNVGFEVLDHGVVANVHIIDSSGNKANDDAAVAAVEKAQPFLDINSTADDDQLLLSFKFDYNYQSHKGSAKKDSDAEEDLEEQATAGKEPSKDTDVLIAKEREHLTAVLAKIAQIKKDPARKDTDLAEAYGDLTHTLKVMGEHQQAVKYLKEALNLADFHSKKNPATLMVLCDLGSVYLTSKKADLAESTLKEVVESPIFTEIPNSNVKQQALDDLGHALCALGHYAEAQKYYSRKHDIN
jgi:TonB family protein